MKLRFLIILSLIFNLSNGQEKDYNYIKRGDFPEGLYMALKDVLNKKPSSTEEIYYKPSEENNSNNLPEKTFFYFKESDKKVRLPLAVSYRGEMYFQTYNKYTNREDRGFAPDAYSRFCKVKSYGRFLYFEENMREIFSKAVLGTIIPASYSINGRTKGIVLDLANKELNILRDCDDLNDFLMLHGIKEINCDASKFTISDLRSIIDQINR